MGTVPSSDGFRQIHRHDGIFQEREHDSYKASDKPLEPTVCSHCGALFHAGRWQWGRAPENAHRSICPACHRIQDHYPAGFISLKGSFFQSHRDEVMHLIRNHEKHEKQEHPLKRIMDVEENEGKSLITTTDIHLARGIGEALHHAYQGTLEFHYNPEQNLLRVNWAR
ncbi:MAG: ATPase [Pseudomonadota bacterium]|nr:ATPase [Pseudomonadota bacterium]